MLNQLLETIIQILTGWLNKFDSHAQHVEDKLDSLDQTASDIETNTEPISDIADNTGAVVTPIQNIKSNTDSIKQSSQTSANNTTAILNNISTLSTNTGRAAAFAEDCANNTLDIKDKVTTIASDTTQLRADTNELNTMSDKIYEAIKWGLVDKYIDETESGASPLTFDTDIADDLKRLIIGLEVQQTGSGDPSPSNIRPITGYSNANITVNGNSIQISLGQTVYTGFLDVISGKLTITHTVKQLLNASAYSGGGAGNGAFFTNFLDSIKTYAPGLCDKAIVRTTQAITPGMLGLGSNSRSAFWFGIVDLLGLSNITEFNTWLVNNPTYVYFELGAPVEVQLTASQIAAINGVNTITSDTNGDIEVTYKESIKHYLDKQDN